MQEAQPFCFVQLYYSSHFTAWQQESTPLFAKTKQKACKDRQFCLFLQAFFVAAVKVGDSHCLLLEELSHTDLIDQPAFLYCLVDHIARLAVPDQKG